MSLCTMVAGRLSVPVAVIAAMSVTLVLLAHHALADALRRPPTESGRLRRDTASVSSCHQHKVWKTILRGIADAQSETSQGGRPQFAGASSLQKQVRLSRQASAM